MSEASPIHGQPPGPFDGLSQRAALEAAFGEEYARVLTDLDLTERRKYFAWMVNNGRRYGVSPEPNYSVAWLLDLEQELTRENPDLTPP